MLLCFSCISYLSFGSEIARKTKTQATVPATVLNLNQQHRPRSIYRLHRFCRARTSEDYRSSYDADKDYWKKCQIYWSNLSKYIQESLINTSLQLYITYLNKHSHFITFHFVYYDQSTP